MWTHINGNIRIDDLGSIGLEENNFLKEAEEFLGPIISYATPDEQWEECNLPLGSEGSILYSIIPPTDHSYGAVINFFGDLRDFPDDEDYGPDYRQKRSIESIEKWFEDVCKHYYIRQGVLQISKEYGSEIILLTYNDADYKTHIHKVEFTKRQQVLASKKDILTSKE